MPCKLEMPQARWLSTNVKWLMNRDVQLTNMAKAIRDFLDEICVDWGFCIPRRDIQRLMNAENLEADEFAREVLIAEGMDPDIEVKWRRKIRARFANQFGASLLSKDFIRSFI
jgi:hypothetical protein